jgi:hypothetical protein
VDCDRREDLLSWYGSRLRITSANLQRRAWLHLRLVSFFVTLMVLLRSGVLLETRSYVSLRLMVRVSLLLLGFCCWYVHVGNFAAFWRGIKSMFWFYLVVGKCKQMGLVEFECFVCQRNGTEVFVLCLCMNVISIILKQMDKNWLWFSFLTPVF